MGRSANGGVRVCDDVTTGLDSDSSHVPAADPCGDVFTHPMHTEEFRKRGYDMVDWICRYHEQVADLPVRSQMQPGYLAPRLPQQAPEQGDKFDAIMRDIDEHIIPGLMHWQSPRFFGFFNCNFSFPGLLGEMLCAALNVVGVTWVASPAATELELVVMDWLAQMLGMPHCFLSSHGGTGVIHGTATEGICVVILAARLHTMRNRSPQDQNRLVMYTSDQAHCCLKKACRITGFDLQRLRVLPTHVEHDWALQPEMLEAAVTADLAAGLIPCFLMATVGTTTSCACDPVEQLSKIAKQHGIWMHVDAAYAGAFAVLPEMRQKYFKGMEAIDSFEMNPHKAMLTQWDCSALWVRDSAPVVAALSDTPEYLKDANNSHLDRLDLELPVGRRFRALKLWFVLRTYGVEGLQSYMRHHMSLAAHFADLVQADAQFELTAPPRFGLVCFRPKGTSWETNAAILEAVNASGRAFLIHSKLGGKFTLRMAIGSTNTQRKHVDAAWEVIRKAASGLIQPNGSG